MHRPLAYSFIQNADWLTSYGRTAKIGFDPICYMERRLRRNGSWNGNGATATEWRKPGINSLV